jgi:hypothetical protein
MTDRKRRRPRDTDEDTPGGKRSFRKRLAEEIKHPRSLQEHPDGSAPPLDRLTQDLDPRKDL